MMQDILTVILEKNNEIKSEYKGSMSVSRLVEQYIKQPFDEDAAAERCALKGLTDPNYKYHNMSAEEIKEQWHKKADVSRTFGSLLDDYTGMVLKGETDKLELWKLDNNFEYNERLKANCTGFDQFYNWLTSKTNYRYAAREIQMFCKTPKNGLINGRLDCLFYDETTGGFIIIDWKTTDDIKVKNDYNKKFLGPAYMLDDCDMNRYTIQLHVYKKALVETYNLATYDKISVYVCNLLKTPDFNGSLFRLYKQNFDFDINKLDMFIDFGSNKHKILKNLKS